jgi:hypothetical protein
MKSARFGTLRPDFIGTCPSGHITVDKREIKDFPKLPSATSFIRKTLYEMPDAIIKRGEKHD